MLILKLYADHLFYRRSYSKSSVRLYLYDANAFISYLGLIRLDEISESNVYSYIKFLKKIKKNGSVTLSRKLSSLKRFILFLVEENVIKNNLDIDIYIKREGVMLPTLISPQNISLVLEYLKLKSDTFKGFQNYLLFNILLYSGLRVSELINLNMIDIVDLEGYSILRVHGKGGVERVIPLKKTLTILINEWKIKREKFKCKYMFFSPTTRNVLSARYVQRLLSDAVLSLNIDEQITPHKLRHTFASNLIVNGSSLLQVQKLLGHKDIRTTLIYTHIVDSSLFDCVEKLNFNIMS